MHRHQSDTRASAQGVVILALCATLILAGCSSEVRPDAESIAASVRAGETADALQTRLRRSGFYSLAGLDIDEPYPPNAQCMQKVRGSAIFGVDVVRVCFANGTGSVTVYSKYTHGRDWTKIE